MVARYLLVNQPPEFADDLSNLGIKPNGIAIDPNAIPVKKRTLCMLMALLCEAGGLNSSRQRLRKEVTLW